MQARFVAGMVLLIIIIFTSWLIVVALPW